MDSYDRDDVTFMVGGSFYMGDLVNDSNSAGYSSSDGGTKYREWFADYHMAAYKNFGYFSIGGGLQSFSPFYQTGFVSPYVGVSLWGNVMGPFFFAGETIRENFSGGAELIEQIPLTENWKLGLTQHFSRNGREAYLDPGTPEGFMALRIDEPRPGFYKEAGGGLYASFKTKKAKFAFEFRYGRDINDKRNRFALTFDFWNLSEMFSKEENREGKNKEENRESENKDEKNLAEKNYKDSIQNKKTNQSLKVMYLYGQDERDSLNSELHKISNRWFRVTDSTKVLSEVYSPSPSVRTIYTDEICYDESQKSIWIKENFEDVAYAVPMDSLDYCDEVEMEIPWGYVIIDGIFLGFVVGALNESWPLFALAGIGGALGRWLLSKVFDDYEPKVSSTTCDMPHSRDDVENWLKQYPCKNEFMNRLERDQIFLPQ